MLTVPMLIGLVLLHERTSNPILCAILWAGILLLVTVLLSTKFHAIVFLFALGWFLLALGYFSLLGHLRDKTSWWVAMPIGAVVLVLVR
jgi:hypothetical protein